MAYTVVQYLCRKCDASSIEESMWCGRSSFVADKDPRGRNVSLKSVFATWILKKVSVQESMYCIYRIGAGTLVIGNVHFLHKRKCIPNHMYGIFCVQDLWRTCAGNANLSFPVHNPSQEIPHSVAVYWSNFRQCAEVPHHNTRIITTLDFAQFWLPLHVLKCKDQIDFRLQPQPCSA